MLITLRSCCPVIVKARLRPRVVGIINVVVIELGMIIPPIGVIVFILHGTGAEHPDADHLPRVVPFNRGPDGSRWRCWPRFQPSACGCRPCLPARAGSHTCLELPNPMALQDPRCTCPTANDPSATTRPDAGGTLGRCGRSAHALLGGGPRNGSSSSTAAASEPATWPPAATPELNLLPLARRCTIAFDKVGLAIPTTRAAMTTRCAWSSPTPPQGSLWCVVSAARAPGRPFARAVRRRG